MTENTACNMPYQKCKAQLANLLTAAGVLANLTRGTSFARFSHDPSGA